RRVYTPSGDNDAAKVESCLNQLSKDVTADYKAWFEIGCSLVNGFGENGRQYFHQVSRFYESYNQREAGRQFDHCLKGYGRISLATFFYYMKMAGIEPERNLVIGIAHPAQPAQPAQPTGNYLETLKDGRTIEMCPAGYPADWN